MYLHSVVSYRKKDNRTIQLFRPLPSKMQKVLFFLAAVVLIHIGRMDYKQLVVCDTGCNTYNNERTRRHLY